MASEMSAGAQRNLEWLMILDHPVKRDLRTFQSMSPSSASEGVSL
jgi:hypothetical protein